jgi:hypothetical protein
MPSVSLSREQALHSIWRKRDDTGEAIDPNHAYFLSFGLPATFAEITGVTLENVDGKEGWRCHFEDDETAMHFLLRWT